MSFEKIIALFAVNKVISLLYMQKQQALPDYQIEYRLHSFIPLSNK